MAKIEMTVNGRSVSGDVEDRTLLVHFLRENLNLTGTHVGCDTSQCGACVVHVDGKAVTTIEGLSPDHSDPLQQAWIDEQVPQCGYCHSGQIMAAAALLADTPAPTDANIDEAMSGVVCRCGTYSRVRRGIKRAAEIKRQEKA